MVKAYDIQGHNGSDEISVTKWRFHPLPFIAGFGMASTLLLFFKHTTVTGVFINLQQSRFATSFYAIGVHYWTNGPFNDFGGVIHFKKCMGGRIIGPILSLRAGPRDNIMYGTFTFLGDIHYNTSGFRQGNNTTNPPTSATILRELLEILQSYNWKNANRRFIPS